MKKYIQLYEVFQRIKATPILAITTILSAHIKFGQKSDKNINLSIIKLTENSKKDIFEIVKTFYPSEYENWIKDANHIILFAGDLPDNLQTLKSKELKFKLDGIAKNDYAIYGRIKGFSFMTSTPDICILINPDKIDNFQVVKNLNYSNINDFVLSGYVKSYEK